MSLEYPYDLNYNITCVYVYTSSVGEVTVPPSETPATETPDVTETLKREEQPDFSDSSRFVELKQSIPEELQSDGIDDDNTEQQEKTQKYAVEYIIDDNSTETDGTNDSVICLVDENIETESGLKSGVLSFVNLKNKIKEYIKKDDKSDIPVFMCTEIGKQWFVSESLYNKYFKDILQTNCYIPESDIVRDISDMPNDLLYNKDIKHWWKINNINYIKNKNSFTDDELDNFSQTFFSVLNKYSNYIYEPGSLRTVSVYNKLVKYYMDNKTDSTMSDIDLILNTNINTTTTNSTGSSFCGCNNTSSTLSDNNINTSQSCYNIYQSALSTWTKEMFSDIVNFYNNWFFDKYTDDSGKECLKPNTGLCNILMTLIDEYIDTNPDIQSVLNTADTNNAFISDKLYCGCSKSEIKSPCDYNVFNNFKKVLEYIKNNEVTANINKIQYWGGQFGELINKL